MQLIQTRSTWIWPIISRLKLAASEKARKIQNKRAKQQRCLNAEILQTQQQTSTDAADSLPLRAGCVPLHWTGWCLWVPHLHKTIWQVSLSPSCPAGRKIKALFLDLSMSTHMLAWLLLASGKQKCFPVQVPLALDMAQVPSSSSSRKTSCSLSTFLYSLALCHARVAGKGQSLLDSTLYCKEKLLPSSYNSQLILLSSLLLNWT